MDDIDLTTDPYRPDATADDRADHTISVLLLDPDPVRRYRTVQALQAGRLREVAAISLLQLREQVGTMEAAAAEVGISRQAATELLTKAGAPGVREQRRRQNYARMYGHYLAAVERLARRQPPEREGLASSTWSRLEWAAITSTVAVPRLEAAATRWLRGITNRYERDSLRAELDEAAAALDGWDAIAKPRHLTIAERSDALVGLHAGRAAAGPAH